MSLLWVIFLVSVLEIINYPLLGSIDVGKKKAQS